MKRLRHEDAVFALALLGAAAPSLIALSMLWLGDWDAKTRWTLTLVIVGAALGFAAAVRARVARPLQSLANLIAAVREGDYSVRGRRGRGDDALAEAVDEVNALSRSLRSQRHADIEAATALSTVIAGLDAAVMVFDPAGALRLANRAAERLFGRGAIQLVGRSAAELEVADLVDGEARRTLQLAPLGGTPAGAMAGPSAGRTWDVRRSEIRLEGRAHQLVVLTDVQRALREEERQAWQRLVRVLGHEINNSLGPIQSIAETLRTTRAGAARPADWEDDVERGLAVIERRSAALGRFMASYARLARLPPPRLVPVDVAAWVRRTVELEARGAIAIDAGPAVSVLGDDDQLDQLLINVLANAVDAAAETGGGVRAGWRADAASVEVFVEDDGPGLPPSANLFVPFFTTKPTGSGIGLVLSRQIAEAHAGRLALANRDGARGCRATIVLPRRA